MKFSTFLCLAVVFALAAVASSSEHRRYTTSSSVFYGHKPSGWVRQARADASQMVNMTIAVKLQNMDKLEELVLDISNPKSENFLNHLTLEEVGKITTDWQSVFTVFKWLSTVGIHRENVKVTPNADFIIVSLPVSHAETALNTEFYHYKHAETGKHTVRCELYSLPKAVDGAIDFIAQLNDVPSTITKMPRTPLVRDSEDLPSGYTGPQTLWKYYGIDTPYVSQGSQSTCSVYESLNQSFDPSDVSQFQNLFNLPSNPVYNVVGPNSPSDCTSNPNDCGEGLLDVEYIGAIAQGAQVTWWGVSADDSTPFVTFLTEVASNSNPPLVHSVSYGSIETEGSSSAMQRFNSELIKLASRGITVAVSSGDDGVANFIARSDSSQCGFSPSFPATAPYVTAVGATQGAETGDTEVACASNTGGLITTGGGFSTVFDQPSYQSSAVSDYLQNGPNLPPLSEFASSGRGYPDVAMAGHNYVVVVGGQELVESGTSASSPVFAGMITLINDVRMQQGKNPLGFLNQILYQLAEENPSVFNDVTSGTNNCCAGQSSPVCCDYGFTAGQGWDPLTGLGSINYSAFSQALIDL